MKEKKLSIIIPVYNVEKYLDQCLQSIITNRVEIDYEIILIDDGSTDRSGIICDKYQKRYEQIKVFHNRNMGLSSARNYGLRKATGEWISFIDSDDIVSPYYLSCISKLLLHDKFIDVFLFRFKEFYHQKDIVMTEFKGVPPALIDKNEAMYLLTTEDWGNYAWNKFYKKSLFNNIQFPISKNYEDIATTYKVFEQANSFAIIDMPLYYYRQRLGSLVHPKSIDKYITTFSDSLSAREKQIDFFTKNNYVKARNNAINYRSFVYMDGVAYLIDNGVSKKQIFNKITTLRLEYKIGVSKHRLRDFLKINLFKLSPNLYALLKRTKFLNNR